MQLRVENLDRAGGQIAASELWRAPRDGSVIGFPRSNLFYAELMEHEALDVRFSELTFFGSLNRGHRVLVLGNESKIRRVEEIVSGDVIVLKSADAVTSSHYYEALLMNALSGSRIRPVPGYSGGARNMAVINGEVDCQIGSLEAVQPILEAGAGRIIFRLSSQPLPDGLPEVPRLADHLRRPDLAWGVDVIDAAAAIGRPLAGPPNTEPEAAALWETLFQAVVEDAVFQAAAFADEGLVVEPASPEEIAARLDALTNRGPSLRTDLESLLTCGQTLSEDLQSACG
jgi:tripartite-type tricarboxylate transporter receptor subunit TctC